MPDSSTGTPQGDERATLSARARFLVDYGPLLVFFGVQKLQDDLILATGVFMLAISLALIVSWSVERRVTPMALVTAVVVIVFGGLTLYFDDSEFIKQKPTIVYGLFAAVLLGGMALGRPLLRPVLGMALQLDEAGWRGFTLRWGLFFIVLALANEVARWKLSDDGWMNYKVFGTMGLILVFTLTQMPFVQRHQLEEAVEQEHKP